MQETPEQKHVPFEMEQLGMKAISSSCSTESA